MAIEHEIESPFAMAVRTIGSQSATARLIGKSQSTVYLRLKSGKPLWSEDVLAVEAETDRLGDRISRHDLRPDIYPRDNQAPARAGSLSASEPAR